MNKLGLFLFAGFLVVGAANSAQAQTTITCYEPAVNGFQLQFQANDSFVVESATLLQGGFFGYQPIAELPVCVDRRFADGSVQCRDEGARYFATLYPSRQLPVYFAEVAEGRAEPRNLVCPRPF